MTTQQQLEADLANCRSAGDVLACLNNLSDRDLRDISQDTDLLQNLPTFGTLGEPDVDFDRFVYSWDDGSVLVCDGDSGAEFKLVPRERAREVTDGFGRVARTLNGETEK